MIVAQDKQASDKSGWRYSRREGKNREASFAGSNPKTFAKTFTCWLSGWLMSFSQERTKAVAIPILVAKW
jgi:hypothetical protein